MKDGFVEVQFKAISGSQDRAAGLVWRAKDADNYYVVRANALENNIVLYKTVKGQRSALDIFGRKGGYGVKRAGSSATVAPPQGRVCRNALQGFFNGSPAFEVEDATFREAGLVGLWTKADSVTSFDDFMFEDTK